MMLSEDLDPLLSLPEAAKKLNLSRSTVYKYVEGRKIAYIRIGGRIRFMKKDLDAWIKARKHREVRR